MDQAELEQERNRLKQQSNLAFEEVNNLASLESLATQMAQREKELDERYQLINEGGFLYNKLLIELFINILRLFSLGSTTTRI